METRNLDQYCMTVLRKPRTNVDKSEMKMHTTLESNLLSVEGSRVNSPRVDENGQLATLCTKLKASRAKII